MIHKTRAIVLHVAPVSETSRATSWLTEDFGRISTLVKGSQRPKSSFLGQYDLFYTCELLFYPRPRTGLHLAHSCSPENLRTPLRSRWREAALASYLMHFVQRATHADAPQSRLFHLTDLTLDHLCGPTRSPGTICFWYELQAMHILGLSPRLRHCTRCGKDLEPRGRTWRFSDRHGGLLCSSCGQDDRSATTLPADVTAILTALQRAGTPGSAERLRCSPAQLGLVARVLGSFLRFHLETALPGRDIALQILRHQHAA